MLQPHAGLQHRTPGGRETLLLGSHATRFSSGFDNNAQHFAQLRTHLSEFFQRQQSNGRSQHVRVVVRIHGYNVPLKSVREEYKKAERKFRADYCRLTESPPDDYVLFVHYAWPSERIGAGGPLCWIRAMPMGLW